MTIKEQIGFFISKSKPIRLRDKETAALYHDIMLLTSFLPTEAKIKERIFCVQNDISKRLICNHCGIEYVKFLGPSTGYRDFCSVKCSSNSEQKQRAMVTTNIQKYGTKTPAESSSIRLKTIKTLESRYGKGVASTQQVDNVRTKTICTNNKKFGVDFYTSSKDFKFKTVGTLKTKYGVNHINQSHISKDVLEKLNDPNWLITQNQQNDKTLLMIAEELQVSISTVSVYFAKYDIIPVYYTRVSKPEQELLDFLASLNIDTIHQDRTLIKPKELDIVIPSHKLAIEFCGLYWHSDVHPRITKQYHLDKLNNCLSIGYRLITIFEDEWIYKKSIVKARLSHLVNKSTDAVYARLTNVVEVDKKKKKDFFDATHIQGDGRGTITYGLTHNNELKAVMTFMNLKNGVYELNRYSTTGNIVGGFSKLLNHFEKTIEWESIISFADRRWSEGAIYYSNGFELSNVSQPSYDYVIKDTRIHRRNFMKGLLSKKLLHYDKNLTEFENCDNNNLLRIWNCGQLKFIKKNS
ncbi:MAG: DUF7487 domain-containing protein [Nitrososphaeraceae archaeon]